MKLRRFKQSGLDSFNDFLDRLDEDPATSLPTDLIMSGKYTEIAGHPIELAPPDFINRLQLARYLHSLIKGAAIPTPENDVGLWSWLSLVFFNFICPAGQDGVRKVRERSAYIPEPKNYRRYYRHLLLGPYLIFRAHQDNPERAMALLCRPPSIIDDLVAQIASRQEFVTNPTIVELSTRLYYDQTSKSLKRGAGGKGPGSPRRLVDVLHQFDVTWDLYGMSMHELMSLLPKEFSKYLRL
jgi:hypothetical protein